MARMIIPVATRSAAAVSRHHLSAATAVGVGLCARRPVACATMGSRLASFHTTSASPPKTKFNAMFSMVRTASPAGRLVRNRRCLFSNCQKLSEWPKMATTTTTTTTRSSSTVPPHQRQKPLHTQPQLLTLRYRYLSGSGGGSPSDPGSDRKETTIKGEEEHNNGNNDDNNTKKKGTFVVQETVYERDAEEGDVNKTDQKALNAKVSDPSTYTVEIPIRMPEIGDGHEGGRIVKWYKQVGDVVQYGDILCDIETKNFTFGMQTEDECLGIVKDLYVPEGSSMAENETICVLLHEPDEGAAPPSSSPPEPAPSQGDDDEDDDDDDDDTDTGTDADSQKKQ